MFIMLLPLERAFERVVNPLYFWASTFFLGYSRNRELGLMSWAGLDHDIMHLCAERIITYASVSLLITCITKGISERGILPSLELLTEFRPPILF